MNIISRIPHEIKTKLHAVQTYRNNNCSVSFICRKYHCSKASLMRWNKKYDGTIQSLINKSHRPLSKHPNSHSDTEISNIKNLIRRNPHIRLNELYTKLVSNYNYKRHCTSLYRVLRSIGFYNKIIKPVKKYIPKPYHTPSKVGEKWGKWMLNIFQTIVTQINRMILDIFNILLLMKLLERDLYILIKNNHLILLVIL